MFPNGDLCLCSSRRYCQSRSVSFKKRSVSFVVDKCNRQQKDADENLVRLHGVLLRIQAIVEESGGWHITNQAMLQQLQMLREAMYKAFRCRMLQQQRTSDQAGGQPFSLSTTFWSMAFDPECSCQLKEVSKSRV
jgi:hypothetical protein